MQQIAFSAFVIALVLAASASAGEPEEIQAVSRFDLTMCMGKWYEIARLDNVFERGMDRVTVEYSLHDDGEVTVVNRGFYVDQGKWKVRDGKLDFAQGRSKAHFTVSYFGPLSLTYCIFDLDTENYQYAFVTGRDKSQLWLLARTPRVSKALTDRFVRTALAFGFDTDNLIYVGHGQTDEVSTR